MIRLFNAILAREPHTVNEKIEFIQIYNLYDNIFNVRDYFPNIKQIKVLACNNSIIKELQ